MNLFCNVKDVFTNPDSPWYYVVGAAFLLVVIGLLVLFIVLDGKKKKKAEKAAKEKAEQEKMLAESAESERSTEGVDGAENSESPVASAANETDENTQSAVNDEQTETDKPNEINNTAEGEQNTEPTSSETAETVETESATVAENAETETTAENEKISENDGENKNEIVADENAETESKAAKPKKSTAKKQPTVKVTTNVAVKQMPKVELEEKKPTKAKTSKAATFIDRLLANKAVHGVYNELKNTVLSYPGIKAKLTKDEELFLFGVDKKAKIALDGDSLTLYLALDPAAVPSQLKMKKSNDAELPVMMTVESGNIDNAQKAVVFAMNVSLLTRNSSHRRVDYVKKAQDAKTRAKAKNK